MVTTEQCKVEDLGEGRAVILSNEVHQIQLTDPPTWQQIMEVIKAVNYESGTTTIKFPTAEKQET
jgi:hypothetical protein